MQYTQLGTSGLTVSRMALGAMTFGQYSFSTFHASVDQGSADEMVGIALHGQLAGNLAAADFALSADEIAELDAAPIYPDPRWLQPAG